MTSAFSDIVLISPGGTASKKQNVAIFTYTHIIAIEYNNNNRPSTISVVEVEM